jgi:exodeoxyribonuclease-3
MVIASFNCNSIRARMPVLTRWLGEVCPDVLCLQETKVQDADFPSDDISACGYHAVFCGEKSYNGVAILSREEPLSVSRGFDGAGKVEGSRLIAAEFDGFCVVNTYVPQGGELFSPKFMYKLDWLEQLESFFSMRYSIDSPLIWLGDFNIAPLALDVYDPILLAGAVGFHPVEHKALDKIKSFGFDDVFRLHHPGQKCHYTFWDYRIRDAIKMGTGWRLDHIWAAKGVAEKSVRSWIDKEPRLWERPSDHTFLCAEFLL